MPSKGKAVETQEKLKVILDALEDKKAVDPEVVELAGKTLVADYFVLAHSTSGIHMRSVTEGVQEAMREKLGERARQEGERNSNWMLLDYGDVVLHVFSEEARRIYDLNSLWQTTEKSRLGDPDATR